MGCIPSRQAEGTRRNRWTETSPATPDEILQICATANRIPLKSVVRTADNRRRVAFHGVTYIMPDRTLRRVLDTMANAALLYEGERFVERMGNN